MNKLYYFYGAMGASKTANALMTKFNFEEKGKEVIMLKPSVDNREGNSVVKSRIGLESNAFIVNTIKNEFVSDQIIELVKNMDIDYIIVDECQFLFKEHIDELVYLVDNHNISVFAFGLKTDFKGNLFEGSKRLLEMADTISEIKTTCYSCGKKAIMNARISDGKILKTGEQIVIGGDDLYISLCRKCWSKNEIEKKSFFNN